MALIPSFFGRFATCFMIWNGMRCTSAPTAAKGRGEDHERGPQDREAHGGAGGRRHQLGVVDTRAG